MQIASTLVRVTRASKKLSFIAWIFIFLILAITTEGAISNSSLLQSYGAVTYTQHGPTPSPAINYASFKDGGWFTDTTWKKCPTLNVYKDTIITYWGQETFRVEPDRTSTVNSGADHWGPTIKPGDHIIMSVWIKTGGVDPVSYAGGRMGFDVYGSEARITGVHSVQQASDGCRTWTGIDENYVHWGSDWTRRSWDFIVPSTYISDGGSSQISKNYAQGQAVTPVTIVPWIQVWGINYPNDVYTCWFSGYTLNINP